MIQLWQQVDETGFWAVKSLVVDMILGTAFIIRHIMIFYPKLGVIVPVGSIPIAFGTPPKESREVNTVERDDQGKTEQELTLCIVLRPNSSGNDGSLGYGVNKRARITFGVDKQKLVRKRLVLVAQSIVDVMPDKLLVIKSANWSTQPIMLPKKKVSGALHSTPGCDIESVGDVGKAA